MDAGIASLLGAVVGASSSLGATVYAEHIRQADAGRAEKKKAAERAVIASRLVQDDLAWAEARVQQALVNERYWSSRYGLTKDSWDQYREDVAIALADPREWVKVHDAFRAIRTLELQASRDRSDNPLSRPELTDFGRSRADEGLQKITQAIGVLEPLAGRLREESSEEA